LPVVVERRTAAAYTHAAMNASRRTALVTGGAGGIGAAICARFAAEGARVFHSADELGSTIAVSCDMCHPDAANTHPETYPKFQKQIGKVISLFEMVNWCLRNPLEGDPLAADDPKMVALLAYITYERRGVPLAPGKH